MKAIIEYLLLLVIIGTLFLLLVPGADNTPPADDAITYISLGKSIVTEHAYVDIVDTVRRPHTYYPFLFPLMLAGVIQFWGSDFSMMRLLNILLLLLSLATVYAIIIKDKRDAFASSIAVLLAGSSIFVLHCVFSIYSEVAYMLFSFLGLISLERYSASKNVYSKELFAAVFFILCAFFTRTMGASLIVASVLFLLFEKNSNEVRAASLKKTFALGTLVSLCVFLWFFRTFSIQGAQEVNYLKILFSPSTGIKTFYPGATDAPRGMLHFVASNVYGMVFCSIPSFIANAAINRRSVTGLLLTSIMAYGLIGRLTKKKSVIEYYFLVYMAVLVFWCTTYFSKRILVPVAPFLFYYFIEGLTMACARIDRLLNVSYLVWVRNLGVISLLLNAIARLRIFLCSHP